MISLEAPCLNKHRGEGNLKMIAEGIFSNNALSYCMTTQALQCSGQIL